MYNDLNDTELVRLLKEGDAQAFTALYRKYAPQLYTSILRMVADEETAKEMLQDIFSRIWDKKENLNMEPNFAGYLVRSAQHLVYHFHKKLIRDKQLQDSFKKAIQVNYAPIEEALQHKEAEALLQKALTTLTPQQKKVFQLVKIDGYSYKEAAEFLGISSGTVKEYLVSANKVIRLYFANNRDSYLELALLYAAITISLGS